MTFRFVDAEKANYPTKVPCRVLGVSTSGFTSGGFAGTLHKKRQADEKLTEQIKHIHGVKGTYGSPRIHAELCLGEGNKIGRKRLARLMSWRGSRASIDAIEADVLAGIRQRKTAEDLVKRNFKAEGPNELWVSDISEHRPTRAKFIWPSSWTLTADRWSDAPSPITSNQS